MTENRDFLKAEMRRSAVDFEALVLKLTKGDFEKNPGGKWSAGQDLSHVVKTLGVIRLGLKMPLMMWRLFYGNANRPSRPYTDFRQKYLEKIAPGFKAPSYVLPKIVLHSEREQLISRLKSSTEDFCERIGSFTETELDRVIVPHPLFGKITMREMIMATWLHQDHHTEQLARKLGFVR